MGISVDPLSAEAQLEANTQAFFNDVVNRDEFDARFGFITNAQYVDNLIANTFVPFSQAERDALVNGLSNQTETRATVLRKVIENPAFKQAEFNKMFGRMQYFGNLRRDSGFGGFEFWLNKLNSFNGNFIQAEMVKAFISSIEYRSRFGPPISSARRFHYFRPVTGWASSSILFIFNNYSQDKRGPGHGR